MCMMTSRMHILLTCLLLLLYQDEDGVTASTQVRSHDGMHGTMLWGKHDMKKPFSTSAVRLRCKTYNDTKSTVFIVLLVSILYVWITMATYVKLWSRGGYI